PMASPGGSDENHAGLHLASESLGTGVRLWARAHGGGLFRSDDGRNWEGPLLPQPVKAFGVAVGNRGVVVASSGWNPEVFRSFDGKTFRSIRMNLPEPPALLACRGDVWIFGFPRAAGLLTLNAGRTAVSWPLLTGVTALSLVETDDGALQVLAGIYDE